MKGSSSQEEERTCIFNVKHPCYFLEEALRPLLRCLGIESEGTTTRSQPQTPPAADSTTNSPTSTQKTSPDAQHPSFINKADSLAKRDNASRSPDLSSGSGPQHN